jgi:hypothetical protein
MHGMWHVVVKTDWCRHAAGQLLGAAEREMSKLPVRYRDGRFYSVSRPPTIEMTLEL